MMGPIAFVYLLLGSLVGLFMGMYHDEKKASAGVDELVAVGIWAGLFWPIALLVIVVRGTVKILKK